MRHTVADQARARGPFAAPAAVGFGERSQATRCRGPGHPHALESHSTPLGGRRQPERGVRGRRGHGRWLPVPGLPARKSEPGFAVQAALESGALSAGRMDGYRKLRREVRLLESKQSARARWEEQARWKRITRSVREHMRMKYGEP